MGRTSKEWAELIRRRPIRRTEDGAKLDKRLSGLAAALAREGVPAHIAALKLAAARRAGLRRVTERPESPHGMPVRGAPERLCLGAFRREEPPRRPVGFHRRGELLPVSVAIEEIDAEIRYIAAIHHRVWFNYGPLVHDFVLPPHPDLPRLIRQLGWMKAYAHWLDPKTFLDPSFHHEPPRKRVKIPAEMQRAIDRRIKQRAKFARFDEPTEEG